MGNIWGAQKVLPAHGTYLEERPRRPVHWKIASSIPPVDVPPGPPVQYKEKARRIFHEIALRQKAFTQGTSLQTRE
jgi:hypothetical protein